jgi:hypothetical protein
VKKLRSYAPALPAQIHISYTGAPGEIAIDFVSDVATGA